MNTKKIIAAFASTAYAALAAAFLLIPIADPADVEAASRCYCFGGQSQTPSRIVSSGSTCAQAESILRNTLEGLANCTDGYCSDPELVITRECEMDDPNWYPVEGFLRFQCRVCF